MVYFLLYLQNILEVTCASLLHEKIDKMMYGQSVDTIIMNDVVRSLNAPEKFCLGTLRTFLFKIPRFILMAALGSLVEKRAELAAPIAGLLKTFARKLLYKRVDYAALEASSLDYHAAQLVNLRAKAFAEMSPPIYVENSKERTSFYYLPLFHSKTVTELEESARNDLQEYLAKATKKKAFYSTFKDGKYVSRIVNELYPSANFTSLESKVRSHFSVCEKVRANNVLGILIDGIPGLGKTKFATK